MDKKYMEAAINLAYDAIKNNTGGPFGAVIVKDGIIVGRGNNQVIASNDPTAHAEIIAIRDACKQLENAWLLDCEIYTSCEPCFMCLGAIYWARIKNIYFGVNRADAANFNCNDIISCQELERPIQERQVPMRVFQRELVMKLFEEWQINQGR